MSLVWEALREALGQARNHFLELRLHPVTLGLQVDGRFRLPRPGRDVSD